MAESCTPSEDVDKNVKIWLYQRGDKTWKRMMFSLKAFLSREVPVSALKSICEKVSCFEELKESDDCWNEYCIVHDGIILDDDEILLRKKF